MSSRLEGRARSRSSDALHATWLCAGTPQHLRGHPQAASRYAVRLDQGQTDPTIEAYWTLRDTIEDAAGEPFRGSATEAIEGLQKVLSESVAEQMIADVPLGAFLSGGIDSSTIVALMQAQSRHRVRTFTIGFHEKRFDEAADARAIARHLGTDHTELYVTPEEAIDAIGLMPQLYDEPFGDSSQLPTFLLARLGRKGCHRGVVRRRG